MSVGRGTGPERRPEGRWLCASVAETRRLGRRLARRLAPDGVLLLYGPMGSGKTVLTQGIAEGLGIERSAVQSPTFTLVHEYAGEEAILTHVDLYRLESHQVEGLGLAEILDGVGVKVVEWAERLEDPPTGSIRLRLEIVDEGSRQLVEEPVGESAISN